MAAEGVNDHVACVAWVRYFSCNCSVKNTRVICSMLGYSAAARQVLDIVPNSVTTRLDDENGTGNSIWCRGTLSLRAPTVSKW
eukprot:3270973-Amphidinium_carterae.2